MRASLSLCLLPAALCATPALADPIVTLGPYAGTVIGEAGVITTPVLNISGPNQSDATRGWGTTQPTGRVEAWLTDPHGWAFGLALQPLNLTYKDNLTNNVNVQGQSFRAGQPASFNLQFPYGLVTANYPVWENGAAVLRVGGSVIVRYAENLLISGPSRAIRTNTLALPLLDLDARYQLNEKWSAVLHADFLPGPSATGIYDIFAGLHYTLDGSRAVEFGGRTFFGGYQPNTSSDLNNHVLLQSVVIRLVL